MTNIHFATTPDGNVAKRTSKTRTYTHAIAVSSASYASTDEKFAIRIDVREDLPFGNVAPEIRASITVGSGIGSATAPVTGYAHNNAVIPNPRFTLADVVVCDSCGHPTIPNLSTEDEDGMGWSCTTPECPEYTGAEIEAEDLIACGCPEWLAVRLAALSDSLA